MKQFGVVGGVFLLILLWQSFINAHDEDKLDALHKKLEISHKKMEVLYKKIEDLYDKRAKTYTINAFHTWRTNTTSVQQIHNLKLDITVKEDSFLVMTANGHIHCYDRENNAAHVFFRVGDTNMQYAGDYHIFRNTIGDGWAPLSLTQMHEVPSGIHTISLQFLGLGRWGVNGTGVQVMVIPK